MVSCSHCPLASHVDPTARTRTLIQPVSALFNPVSMVLAEKELNKTLEKVFASYAWEVHYRLFVLSRNKKKKKSSACETTWALRDFPSGVRAQADDDATLFPSLSQPRMSIIARSVRL